MEKLKHLGTIHGNIKCYWRCGKHIVAPRKIKQNYQMIQLLEEVMERTLTTDRPWHRKLLTPPLSLECAFRLPSVN